MGVPFKLSGVTIDAQSAIGGIENISIGGDIDRSNNVVNRVYILAATAAANFDIPAAAADNAGMVLVIATPEQLASGNRIITVRNGAGGATVGSLVGNATGGVGGLGFFISTGSTWIAFQDITTS
jgi:hypothetical protein